MNPLITEYLSKIPNYIIYIISIPVALIAITMHEYSHALSAYMFGDPTAKLSGRLSINPIRHLDIFGLLCLIVFRIGWATPVPINSMYFKHKKLGVAFTALAGPLSNFILSFLAVPTLILLFRLSENATLTNVSALLLSVLIDFLMLFHTLNLGLCVFNLIPIPPLDGSRIILFVLPTKWYFAIMKYERYISIALLILLYLGFGSVFISNVVNRISELMFSIFSFIS